MKNIFKIQKNVLLLLIIANTFIFIIELLFSSLPSAYKFPMIQKIEYFIFYHLGFSFYPGAALYYCSISCILIVFYSLIEESPTIKLFFKYFLLLLSLIVLRFFYTKYLIIEFLLIAPYFILIPIIYFKRNNIKKLLTKYWSKINSNAKVLCNSLSIIQKVILITLINAVLLLGIYSLKPTIAGLSTDKHGNSWEFINSSRINQINDFFWKFEKAPWNRYTITGLDWITVCTTLLIISCIASLILFKSKR
tara:strand:- start:727 stop:1476 length:750 start_codon:yes stop_codon:yes gene_type:complete